MAFSLSLIIILGLIADYLFRQVKIPGLIGMLLVGVVAGPYVLDLISPDMMNVSGDFRKIALIVILLRAGFELRSETLNRVGRPALLMSMVPALFEILGVTLVAPQLLGMTYTEALILGSILAAVSPAVVVPLMIEFMEKGRGTKKGIPTLILAASSLDDVFVIVLFTVFLGMNEGTDSSIFIRLSEIPISVISGVGIGLLAGYILHRLFMKYDWKPPKRTLIVMGVAILLTWIEEVLSQWLAIASLLGVMAIGYVILEKSEPIAHLISGKLKRIWIFAELLLFVLVGAQVNIKVAWHAGLAGTFVIIAGLIFRSVGAYLSLLRTDLNWKERVFCVISYIPKATVQAAIGAVPLSLGVASGDLILAIAVLSIVLTAPLGAIGIKLFGERILDHGKYSAYRFKDLRERLGLPRVGQRVLNKKYGTVWKVIEEREEWRNGESPIPVIYIRFWSETSDPKPGKGKTISYYYTPDDISFQVYWEVLFDF